MLLDPARSRPWVLLSLVLSLAGCSQVPVQPSSPAMSFPASVTGGDPYILSGYGSWTLPGGGPRRGPHPAIDFDGSIGDPVLAAAPGRVYRIWTPDTGGGECGNGIRLYHDEFNRFTMYCQLKEVRVQSGDRVERGQVIGLLGASGGVRQPMLHFELANQSRYRNDGDLDGTYDPLPLIVGCFDPAKTYPTDLLVLTYPVRCKK